MEIKKAHWTTDGDNYRMEMPLTKIDKENRLVSGWASLDNPDLQGDIVLAEASQRAFAKFRGNIREMHQPIAVGRMVSYRPDSYFDSITQKFYNGIFVTVYISKGAQDTWEKVLDGTLQAFSIHGPIVDSEMEFSKDSEQQLRIIKDYELTELSLVDSGGNQFANVMSITKTSTGELTLTGMVTEIKLENVFWCDKDKVAKTSTDESSNCLHCNNAMKVIGWIESNYGRDTKVAEIVNKYNTEQASSALNKGGVNVAEEKENAAPAGSTTPVVNEVVEQGRAKNEVDSSVEEVAKVEKAADVSEVEINEPDVAKMLDDLKEVFTKGFETSQTVTRDAIAGIEERVAEVTKSFEEKVNQLNAEYTKLAEKFDSVKSGVEEVEKRINSVEDSTAVKKSGDLGGSKEEPIKKGIWAGSLLG